MLGNNHLQLGIHPASSEKHTLEFLIASVNALGMSEAIE